VIQHICNRCKAIVREGVIPYEVETDALRRRIAAKRIDLCDQCAPMFEQFLKGGTVVPPKPTEAPQAPAATEGFDF
jgi:hypothetical protein